MASDYKGAKIIAGAITSAALLIVTVPIVRGVVAEVRARRAVAELNREADEWSRDLRRKAAVAAYQATPVKARPIPLGADEICMQGTVVRVLRVPTKGYEQVLERGRPVRCYGRNRL